VCKYVGLHSVPVHTCMTYAGVIVHVNLSPGKYRLGGSALAQCYNQLGERAPDLDSPELLAIAFDITQGLLRGTFEVVISDYMVVNVIMFLWVTRCPSGREFDAPLHSSYPVRHDDLSS